MKDLGDFQTPPGLVQAILETLDGWRPPAPDGGPGRGPGAAKASWRRVLEPSCGRGNFIAGLLAGPWPPDEIIGIEIQRGHAEAARRLAGPRVRVEIRCADAFQLDFGRDLPWATAGPLLVIGNPPWVTRAALGAMGSANVPQKANPKGLVGLDAVTGAANFDLAEAFWIKLLRELAHEAPTIALLCKVQVARNVLEYAWRAGIPVGKAAVYKVDSRKWFGASVDGCLLVMQVEKGAPAGARPCQAEVYPRLGAGEPEAVAGLVGGQWVADVAAYARAAFMDGEAPLEWRQGVKHDAARVMELTRTPEGYRNGLGEAVAVEPAWVYPLYKGSDLQRPREGEPRRAVLITQRHLADDTARLEREAPRLWAYLCRHREVFRRRKSSVYRGRPDFALFGIGPYAFSPYKVAVPGLYPSVRFRALGPYRGQPPMVDDTCYYLPCYSPAQAALLEGLLNRPEVGDLVRALVVWGSKRPVTKRILQRIDWRPLLRRIPLAPLVQEAGAAFQALAGPGGAWDGVWPPATPEDVERILGLSEAGFPEGRGREQLAEAGEEPGVLERQGVIQGRLFGFA